VRTEHFETLRPVCPVCKADSGQLNSLVIADVTQQEGTQIVQGVLHCTHGACQREFPVIDGVPLIIRNIRSYLSENAFQIALRDDLSPNLESLLGDCLGAGSTFDICRQHLSSYTWDHYADLDPQKEDGPPIPGSMVRVMHQGLDLADTHCSLAERSGPMVDIGCSVGRSTFALAERYRSLTLGVDLNFPMLRLASRLLRTGTVSYPRRRVGLVYDRREFHAPLPNAELVDFWACDAMALPFADGAFAAATSMNMLDCVASPVDFLGAMASVLGSGAPAVITCPYDWSISATPMECWIGGHSQRGPEGGASEPAFRRLLKQNASQSRKYLHLLAEKEVEWQVRVHSRSTMCYKSHLVLVQTEDGVSF
jgi:ubiquinone/menaquinone biosynthesis C-methylase UbiE/uncharacterized protein YbaR (Trm112 family)